jgi:hypothetical protein
LWKEFLIINLGIWTYEAKGKFKAES